MKKYIVRLTEAQRQDLQYLVSTGTESARLLLHARILLKADSGAHGPGWTDAQIGEAVEVSPSTLVRVRRVFAEQGLQAAINRRSLSRTRSRRLDGEQEAHLIALTCSAPPDGRDHWSLRLLADRLVVLEVVEEVSHETVRQVLKKTNSNPGKSSTGASLQKPMPSLCVRWRTPWTGTSGPTIPAIRWFVWTRSTPNCWLISAHPCQSNRVTHDGKTTNRNAKGSVMSLWLTNRGPASAWPRCAGRAPSEIGPSSCARC